MSQIKQHKGILITAGVGLVVAIAAFFIGAAIADESSKVADLEDQVSSLEGDVSSEQSRLSIAETEREEALERATKAEEQLAAERNFKGEGAKQVSTGEYNTDYPFNAAGTVGWLTIKPTAWEKQGGKYILTVEAKNESKEPQSPFCGGGEAVVIDAEENQYSGDNILFAEGTNTCEDLQPGATGVFKDEFSIAANAVPIAVALYGDYSLEEEAKLWELPSE